MQLRLSFLAICSLLLGLLSPSTVANSLTANLEVIAVADSKPGEVELTFFSRIASKSLSSYLITAKPKSGVGLTFTKRYTKKASGYITHKISPLSPEVDYIFTITATTTNKRVIRSAPYNYLVSSTVPSTPLITKVEATDADEAVVFFAAPKDDGGTPIYYYTITSNPGAISVIAPIQGSGSVTITGLTKATTYTFTLTAHNINGSSRAATSPAPITTLAEKIVRVSPTSSSSNAPTLAAPAFTLSSSSQSVIVNNAITTVTNTSTGGAISSYAISPAAPAGLTFSTTTGQLSGTPTSTQSATAYTITATNAAGSATQTFTLTVTAPLAVPAFTLSSVAETRTVNTAATGFTINSTGGAIASFSINTTPPGMSFNTTTGALTGTPNTVSVATAYTITATNTSGSATQTFTLTVIAVVYTVGQTGPGGGKIFYVAPTPFACGPTRSASCTYLEAAPHGWYFNSTNPSRNWAQTTPVDYSTTTVGSSGGETATASAIGWGYRNTRAIINQGNSNSDLSAAALADSHTVTVSGIVYDDWFLPSQDELKKLYDSSFAADQAYFGNAGDNGYWSSTEFSSSQGWSEIFASAYNNSRVSKNQLQRVHPIRAF
jgi:hypothetical protein